MKIIEKISRWCSFIAPRRLGGRLDSRLTKKSSPVPDWESFPKLISLRSTANLLNVHPNTLRKWDQLGRLPAVRLGTRQDRRYELHRVRELWQATQTTPSESIITRMVGRQDAWFWFRRRWLRPLAVSFATVAAVVVISQMNQVAASQPVPSSVTFMARDCQGWQNAGQAEKIDLPELALPFKFSGKNSARYDVNTYRVKSQPQQTVTMGSLDASIGQFSCAGFTAKDFPSNGTITRTTLVGSFISQAIGNEPDGFILETSRDGTNWIARGVIPTRTEKQGRLIYDLGADFDRDALSNLRIRITPDVDISTPSVTAWLDGLAIQTDIVTPATVDPKKNSQAAQDLNKLVVFSRDTYASTETPVVTVPKHETNKFLFLTTKNIDWTLTSVTLVDNVNKPTKPKFTTSDVGGGSNISTSVNFQTAGLHPGKYKVKVAMRNSDGGEATIEKEFLWGVVAINFDRSSPRPGDKVKVGLGILDDGGRTICDAVIEAKVTAPHGKTTRFAIDDQTIVVNKDCVDKGVTNEPDYHWSIKPSEPGVYHIAVKSTTAFGERSLEENLTVDDSTKFDVQRSDYPTRIYPPAEYPVRIAVTSLQDYQGIVREEVPADFTLSDIRPTATVRPSVDDPSRNIIEWEVDWEQDVTYFLGFTFDAPDISPALFLTGPLKIGGSFLDAPLFREPRQWQIASDAICNATTTGNWSVGGNWTGCTGAGGVPATTDTITINDNVMITADTTTTVAGITIADPATGNNGLSISTGVTITVDGNVAYTANTSANTQTITLNGTGGMTVTGSNTLTIPAMTSSGSSNLTCAASATGTLSVGGAFSMTSSSTASQTGATTVDMLTCTLTAGSISITGGSVTAAELKASTGTLTSNAAWSFAGTAANAKVTTSGAATVNTAGDFNSGATVSFNSASTFVVNASSAIANYTYTNFNVASGTTTLNAGMTVSGTLTVGTNNVVSIASSQTLTHSGATLTLNGTISGAGRYTYQSATALPSTGTLSSILRMDATNNAQSITCASGGGRTLGGAVEFYSNTASSRSITICGTTSHVLNISGAVTVEAAGAGGLTVEANTYDPAINITGNVSGGTAGGGTETTSLGSGTWTVSGSVALTNGALSNYSNNTFVMNGASSNTLAGNNQIFYNLTIDPSTTATISLATSAVKVYGTLTIAANDSFNLGAQTLDMDDVGTCSFVLNGTITSPAWTSGFYYGCTTNFPSTGTTSNYYTTFNASNGDFAVPGRAFTNSVSSVSFYRWAGSGTGTITLGTAGGQTFSVNGGFRVSTGNAGHLTVDASTNSPNVTVGQTVDFTKSTTGVPTLITGAGTYTISQNSTFTNGTVTATTGNTWVMNGSSRTLTTAGNALYNFSVTGGSTTMSGTTTLTGNLTVSSGTLTAPSSGALNVGGNFVNDATFVHNNSTLTLNGTTSTTLDTGCVTVTSCTNEDLYSLVINKTAGAGANDEVALTSTGLRVANTLTVTAGELVQGGLNVQVDTGGSVSVAASGIWTNISDGDLYLGGGFDNAGSVTFSSSNAAQCTDVADDIVIDSTVDNTLRTWSGAGTYVMRNINVDDMSDGAITITIYTSTKSGDTDWTAGTCGIDVSGTIYQTSNEGTVFDCNAVNLALRVSVNGAAATTGTCSAVGGTFTVSGVTDPGAANIPVTIYTDDTANPSQKTTTVTLSSGGAANITGISLIIDRLIVTHENAGPMTNTKMKTGDNTDVGIRYSIATSGTDNLTVEDGMELHVLAGKTFTPGGTTLTSVSADGTDSVLDGDIHVPATSTLSMGVYALSVGGDFTNAGTLTLSAGQVTTMTATGTGFTFTSGGQSLKGLTFDGSGGGWTNSGALTVSESLLLTAGTFTQAADTTLTVNGTAFTIANGATWTKTSGTGKLVLDGTPSALIFTDSNTTKQNLGAVQIGASPGTTTLSSDMSADTVTIPTSDTFNTKGYEVTTTGAFDCQSGCTLDLTSTGGESDGTILDIGGDVTVNAGATFTSFTNSKVFANSTSGNRTFITGGKAFNDVELKNTDGTNDDITISGNLDVNGVLTLTDGQIRFDTNDPNVTLNGNLSINANATLTKADNGTATWTFDGATSPVTWTDGTGSGGQDLGLVTISGTTKTVNLGSSAKASKLTIAASQTFGLGSSGYTFTLTGSGTGASEPFQNSGTLNEGTNSTFVFAGTANTNIEPETFYHLSIAPNGGVTPTYVFDPSETAAPMIISGNLVVGDNTSGVILIGGAFSEVTISGNMTIQSSAEYQTSSDVALFIGGSYTNNGTFTGSGSGVNFTSTTSGKTLNGTMTGASKFISLVFNGSGGEWSNTAAIETSAITMLAGTFTGSADVTVTTAVTGTGGVINRTGGTFTIRLSASQNFGPTTASTGWTFNDFTFGNSHASAPLTVTTQNCSSCSVTVNGVLRVGKSGDAAGATTTLTGATSTWTLAGTSADPFILLSSPAGVFTANTSTVNYTGVNGGGNVNITNTTYSGLTCNPGSAEIYDVAIGFTVSGTLTVASNCTLTIASSQTLTHSGATLTLNGTISGAGRYTYQSATALPATGTISSILRLDTTNNDQQITCSGAGRTLGGVVEFYNNSASARVITLCGTASHILNISGAVTVEAANTGGLTVEGNTYDPAVNIAGDFTGGTAGGGTETASMGAGTWTMSGDVSFANSTVSNTANGTLTMSGATKALTTSGNSLYNFISSGTITMSGTTTITNDLAVTSGTLTAPSSGALNVGGDFVNDATFVHNSSTLTLNGTTSTTLDTGCVTVTSCTNEDLYSLVINKTAGAGANDNVTLTSTGLRVANTLTITAGELVQGALNVQVDTGGSVSVGASGIWTNIDQGDLTLGGGFTNAGTATFNSNNGSQCADGANDIVINSTVANTTRLWTNSGTLVLYNVEADDMTDNSITAYNSDLTDPQTTWSTGSCGIDVSGTIYQTSNEGTVFDCNAVNLALRVSVNGAAATTGTCSAVGGTFTVSGVTDPGAANIPVTIYTDDTANPSQKTTTVTLSSGGAANITGISLIIDRLIVTHENAGPMTNTLLDTANNNGDAGIRFGVSAGALSVNAGMELHVLSGKTFTPGGAVTTTATGTAAGPAGDLHIAGTLTMGTNTLNVGGDYTNAGTFNKTNTQATMFSATGSGFAVTPGTGGMNNVTFSGDSGGNGGWTLTGSDLTVDGALTVNSGDSLTIDTGRVLTNSGTTDVNNDGTITGAGTLVFPNGAGGPDSNANSTGTYSSIIRFDASSGDVATSTVDARTYSGRLEFYANSSSDRTITMNSGTYTTSGVNSHLYVIVDGAGDVHLNADNAGSSNPTVTISANLDFTGSGNGTGIISAGSNTWTVGGTADFRAGLYAPKFAILTPTWDQTTAKEVYTQDNAGACDVISTTYFSEAASSTTLKTGQASYVGEPNCLYYGEAIVDSYRHGLRFDLSSIPSTATITGGYLREYVSVASSQTITFGRAQSDDPSTFGDTTQARFDDLNPVPYDYLTPGTTGKKFWNLRLPGAQDLQTRTAGSQAIALALSGDATEEVMTTYASENATAPARLFVGYAATATTPTLTMSGTGSFYGDYNYFYTLNISGTVTLADFGFYVVKTLDLTGSTLTSGTTDPVMIGSSTIIGGGKTLYRLTIATNGTVTLAGSDLTVSYSLAITDGSTLSIDASRTLTSTTNTSISGTITGSGTLLFPSGSNGPGATGTISSVVRFDATAGDITSATFDARTYGGAVEIFSNSGSARSVTAPASGTFTFSSSVSTMSIGGSTLILDLDDTTDPTVTIAGTMTIGANTTLQAPSSTTLTLNGDYTNNGTFTDNGGTVTLAGGSHQTLSGTMTGSSDFNNLVVTNSSSSGDPDSDASTPSVTFGAAASAVGTFTASTANTKLRFSAGATYTFVNVTINGGDVGTRVHLRSSTGGTQWNLTSTGVQTISYVNVRDSYACGGDTIDASNGTSFDGTKNDCWLINFISLNISDTTISFGSCISAAPRYATGTAGSASDSTDAHTITVATNARSGYSLTVAGATLTSTVGTITAIGGSPAASSDGTEQFGLRSIKISGTGAVSSPFDTANWAFTAGTTQQVASYAGASSSYSAEYGLRYICNVSDVTEAGEYSTDLTYVVTSTF